MSEAESSERSLARSSAAMAAGTAVSRLLGFLRTALLLQPRVVVDGHPGQLGHLLPAQSRGTAAGAGRGAHVGRVQTGPAAAQEVGEFGSVHPSSVRESARLIQGLPIP